jgi:hypothetical protein
MTHTCRVCGKDLMQFDDIVWRCRRNETHRASIIISKEFKTLDFEHILIYHEPDVHYGFEFNYLQNNSQISKVQVFRNGDEMPTLYEISTPLYNQSGILEVDFTDLKVLIDKMEKMETFS